MCLPFSIRRYRITLLHEYALCKVITLLAYYAVTRFFHFSNGITLLRYYTILCRCLPFSIRRYRITLYSLQKLLPYYLITLPYYAVTPFFADVSSIFHSLLPITLSHEYVFCKRLMRYYLLTLLHGVLCRRVFHFLYAVTSLYSFSTPHVTMDLFLFPARCILSFSGKFIDYMFYLVMLFRYLIVLGHCWSHPLAVLLRELDFNNGMSKNKHQA